MKCIAFIISTLTMCAAPSSLFAGFDVTAWNLSTGLADYSSSPPPTNTDEVLSLSNPLIHTSHAQIGASFTTAQYDYGWLRDIATGHFNTNLTHAIRAPKIRSVSDGRIFILPSEDIRVTVTGQLSYFHTPGDEFSIDFAGTLRNMDTNLDVFNEHRKGGNLYLLPSTGTLTFSNEAILSAGTLYRLRYALDTGNTGDLLPTGTLDATGYVNFAIEPVVPEPATALLLLLLTTSPIARRRRRT